MSSFDLTRVTVEFIIGDTDEESVITAFRHHPTGKDLDFGVAGTWLVDAEGQFNMTFPKEKGCYIMQAYWHDDKEIITDHWDLKKIG